MDKVQELIKQAINESKHYDLKNEDVERIGQKMLQSDELTEYIEDTIDSMSHYQPIWKLTQEPVDLDEYVEVTLEQSIESVIKEENNDRLDEADETDEAIGWVKSLISEDDAIEYLVEEQFQKGLDQ